jgi:hypothetical protein
MMIGAHEGFHAIVGAMEQTWPAWVNESWANYYAYRAAARHLNADALAVAKKMVNVPIPTAILEAQRRYDAGDGSQGIVFYSSGARFWAAIEDVLTTPANDSGRLAALIKATHGMRGLDWSNATAIAAYFDARSSGRAGPIVRCYLERECAEGADRPL